MKDLKDIIIEKLKLNKDIKVNEYTCQPKDTEELRKILKERLKKDENADLNDIDVSEIDALGVCFYGGLFEGLDPHNIKIDKWNVSNAISLSQMFYECKNLDCDISDWDVSNIKAMDYMFNNCENFNCDLSKWDVSNVKSTQYMFCGCKKFEGKGLEKWDVSNIKNMKDMFINTQSMKKTPNWYHE